MDETHFDAVIVGSGFGGSVMAYRLAEAGLRVCLLERGKAYPPGSFPRSSYRMRKNFWDPSEAAAQGRGVVRKGGRLQRRLRVLADDPRRPRPPRPHRPLPDSREPRGHAPGEPLRYRPVLLGGDGRVNMEVLAWPILRPGEEPPPRSEKVFERALL